MIAYLQTDARFHEREERLHAKDLAVEQDAEERLSDPFLLRLSLACLEEEEREVYELACALVRFYALGARQNEESCLALCAALRRAVEAQCRAEH